MGVDIGSRYTQQHVVRYDSLAGIYEELNSPVVSKSELYVQRAMLERSRGGVMHRLLTWFGSHHDSRDL